MSPTPKKLAPPGIRPTASASAVLAAAFMVAAAPEASAAPSPAPAGGCPDVEVLFARGTDEDPGLGRYGDQLVSEMVGKLPGKRITSYAVDYPASWDFQGSTVTGVRDATARIRSVESSCRDTKLVLGGFSQGAAVAGYVTEDSVPVGLDGMDGLTPLTDDEASRVAAVILMGTPAPWITGIFGGPAVAIGPKFADKALRLCADGDPVCADGGDIGWSAHNSYGDGGMIGQGAQWAVDRINGVPVAPWSGGQEATAAPYMPEINSASGQVAAPYMPEINSAAAPAAGSTAYEHGSGTLPGPERG